METHMKDEAETSNWRHQLVWGAVLITAGVAFLLDRIGQLELGHLWRYWPVLMVIAGLSNMVPPTTPKLVLNGLSWIAFGAWFFVSMERLWGLGFHNSWPILIIMWGVKLALKPVLGNRLGKQE
jgi:hypothetical protein